MDINKKIDEIFKSNSKIPFMQSKEILKYGYELGLKENSKIEVVTKDKKEEYNNSKLSKDERLELIMLRNYKKNEEKRNKDSREIRTEKEEEIKKKAKLEVIGELFGEIYKARNLQQFYEKMQDVKNKYYDY